MTARRLTLKRDVLQELGSDDLAIVAGGTRPDIRDLADTMYSCLHYISCAVLHTCWAPESLLCLQTEG